MEINKNEEIQRMANSIATGIDFAKCKRKSRLAHHYAADNLYRQGFGDIAKALAAFVDDAIFFITHGEQTEREKALQEVIAEYLKLKLTKALEELRERKYE